MELIGCAHVQGRVFSVYLSTVCNFVIKWGNVTISVQMIDVCVNVCVCVCKCVYEIEYYVVITNDT